MSAIRISTGDARLVRIKPGLSAKPQELDVDIDVGKAGFDFSDFGLFIGNVGHRVLAVKYREMMI
ncbi:hypothetical protein QV13_28350 [Mesorhizobium hungaricum]|uniref:Uncharacterized protein n=1 Tax=Mesorhizobium hungaricum TaxID=1566387 RepID=A0A1C2DF61_9HYPH|nr:hypothetical protein QV13_28350 [Mesorhizobium hungaricum]